MGNTSMCSYSLLSYRHFVFSAIHIVRFIITRFPSFLVCFCFRFHFTSNYLNAFDNVLRWPQNINSIKLSIFISLCISVAPIFHCYGVIIACIHDRKKQRNTHRHARTHTATFDCNVNGAQIFSHCTILPLMLYFN